MAKADKRLVLQNKQPDCFPGQTALPVKGAGQSGCHTNKTASTVANAGRS